MVGQVDHDPHAVRIDRADQRHDPVLDFDIPRQAESCARKIGYMTQRFSLWEDLTVRENLKFLAEISGCRRPRRERVERADRANTGWRVPRPARRHDERRPEAATGAGRAVIHEPELLFSTNRPARSIRRSAAISGRTCSSWPKRHHDPRIDPLDGRSRAMPRLAILDRGRSSPTARRRR